MEQKINLSDKKKPIIITIVIICVIAIVISVLYHQNLEKYKKHVSDARYYISMGDYDKAYDEIKDLNAKSKDDELFEKIQLVKFTQLDLDMFNLYIEGIGGSPDYERSLSNLLSGFKSAVDNEKKASELGVSPEMDSLKGQFLNNLSRYFNLSESEALNLAKMDYEQRETEIEKIASRGAEVVASQKQEEFRQSMIEANPIEILNTKGEIDGDYIYVTGAVKNVSNSTHSYIKVKVVYTNTNGDVVDTDWTYASSEELRPNEQKYFKVMTEYRNGMDKFRVEIMDFD